MGRDNRNRFEIEIEKYQRRRIRTIVRTNFSTIRCVSAGTASVRLALVFRSGVLANQWPQTTNLMFKLVPASVPRLLSLAMESGGVDSMRFRLLPSMLLTKFAMSNGSRSTVCTIFRVFNTATYSKSGVPGMGIFHCTLKWRTIRDLHGAIWRGN